MHALFQTQSISIGDLFAGSNAFRIPPFQRPYAWEQEHAAQLYDDIDAVHQRSGNFPNLTRASGFYFLGPIIVTRATDASLYDVVDGQQRLATLFCLLAVLRDALPPGKAQSDLQQNLERPAHALLDHARSARVLLQTSSREEFQTWTQANGSTNHLPTTARPGAPSRLLEVIKYLKQEIGSPRSEAIEALATFVLKKTFVVMLTASTLDDAFLLFRSVNTPGQPLSALDLIKADLLGRNPASHPEVHKLAEAWEKLEQELSQSQLEQYVGTVLKVFMPSYDGQDLRTGLHNLMADPQRATGFRARLEAFVQNYAAFDSATLGFGASSTEINRTVACFQGLPFDDWRPTALLWLTSGPASSMQAGGPSPKKTADFFRFLNALCIGLVILGIPKTKRLKRFSRIDQRINDNKDVLALDSELLLAPQERVQIRNRLKGPLTEKAKYLKALLLRMNAEMLPAEIPPYFPANITLEHVLPQNPSRGSRWVQDFPDARRRKDLCYLLGNMTILTHPANSSVGNADFVQKKTSLFGVNGNQAFAMNAEIVRRQTWTDRDILERQEIMLDLADRVMRL